MIFMCCCLFFFFKQKTAYEMRISDWSSDVCSSDLLDQAEARRQAIATELKPLYDAFNTARNAANPNQASLNTQAQTIRQREEAGKQELARLQQPAARAQGSTEEPRGGEGEVSTCRSRVSPYHTKQKCKRTNNKQ